MTDPKLLDGELITHYVYERNRDLGLTTVLLSARAEDLPNECECIVRCDGTFEGIYNTRDGMSNGTKISTKRAPKHFIGFPRFSAAA